MPEKTVDKKKIIADLIVVGIGVKMDIVVPEEVAEGLAGIIYGMFPEAYEEA